MVGSLQGGLTGTLSGSLARPRRCEMFPLVSFDSSGRARTNGPVRGAGAWRLGASAMNKKPLVRLKLVVIDGRNLLRQAGLL